jgi:hypothetical protein
MLRHTVLALIAAACLPTSGLAQDLLIGAASEGGVKAIVIESSTTKAALVTCDLDRIEADLAAKARAASEKEAGIPGANILIVATRIQGAARAEKAQWDGIAARIAETVKRAQANAAPGRLRAGVGREESVSFYDRYLMRDGTVKSSAAAGDADIVQPMGAIDPEVAVVDFMAAGGKSFATLVNFALQPTASDFTAPMAQVLQKIRGPDFLVLFAGGAAANLSGRDARDKSADEPPVHSTGTILAGEVIKTSARAKAVDLPGLAVSSRVIEVPAKDGTSIKAEVQTLALGRQLAWVAVPGELFGELGTAIKKASPFDITIVVESANGSIGTIPTRKAYTEGGAEVQAAICAEGAGEIIAEEAIRQLAALRRASR